MSNLKEEICKIFNEDFIKANINGVIYKENLDFKILISEKIGKEKFYHFEIFYENKVRHRNIENKYECIDFILSFLDKGYKQMDIYTTTCEYKILMNKKQNYKVIKKEKVAVKKIEEHNKKKEYILEEGTPYPFLVSLDIMDKDGKIYAKARKKFVQVNKYLEEVSRFVSFLPENPVIVDVGCGKSYLTFALYYFLREHLKKNCRVIGIDIKKDVIKRCDELKRDMGYNELEFYNVSIEDFKKEIDTDVNMVVSLHACNTATDYALYSGVLWESDVILAVPCCHKELYGQVKNNTLDAMLKHGILKEKFQSLLCDTLRGLCLESVGYSVKISEFVDMEHSPKNVLISATKTENNKVLKDKALKEYKTIANEFNIDQTLYNLLYKGK
ncbi:MAG: class I SAM-dependent methyltransferase [Lachnospirales bacterium]